MKNATMLYKMPGSEPIHGAHYSTLIVDAAEPGAIEKAQADGWFLTTPEAAAAYEESKNPPPVAEDLSPPTRVELEYKAATLGINFTDKTSDEKLSKLIADKLKA